MKAVIFDLGHTLIDYYTDWTVPEGRAISNIYEVLSEWYPRRPSRSEFSDTLTGMLEIARERRRREMIEIPLSTILSECFESVNCPPREDIIEEGLRIFYEALLEHRRLVPGTIEMLLGLRDGGYSIGLISDVAWGLPSEYPKRDMRHYSLDRFFDDRVFPTDVGFRKPNPRMFHISLESLGVSAEEAVYVGNNLQADIRGALDSGLKAVLKRSDYFFPDDSIVPDAFVDEWSEFDRVLSSL